MVKNQHLRTGQLGEQQAEVFLLANSLKILEKNYTCKYGEIDLICWHNNFLVFVEVRKRKKSALVSANESINGRKQEKLRKSALFYLQNHYENNPFPNCRFDAICINGNELEWIQNFM